MGTVAISQETSTAKDQLLGKTFTVLVPEIITPRDLRRGRLVVEQSSFVTALVHLVGCRHDWGFPHTSPSLRSQYPEGFDSHRTCTRCGSKQLYSLKRIVQGPYFTETV